MSKPTARKLIHLWNQRDVVRTESGGDKEPDAVLISRVEKVLEACEKSPLVSFNAFEGRSVSIVETAHILRLLDGEDD